MDIPVITVLRTGEQSFFRLHTAGMVIVIVVAATAAYGIFTRGQSSSSKSKRKP